MVDLHNHNTPIRQNAPLHDKCINDNDRINANELLSPSKSEDVENIEVAMNQMTRQDLILYKDCNNYPMRDKTSFNYSTPKHNLSSSTHSHSPPSSKLKQLTPGEETVRINVRRSQSSRRHDRKNRRRGVLQRLRSMKRGKNRDRGEKSRAMDNVAEKVLVVGKTGKADVNMDADDQTEVMSSSPSSCVSTPTDGSGGGVFSRICLEQDLDHGEDLNLIHGMSTSTKQHVSNARHASHSTPTNTKPTRTLDQLLAPSRTTNSENDSTSSNSNISTNTGFTSLLQSMVEYLTEASSSQHGESCLSNPPTKKSQKNMDEEEDQHSDIVPCCSPTSPENALAATLSDEDEMFQVQQSKQERGQQSSVRSSSQLPPMPPKDSTCTTSRLQHSKSPSLSFDKSKSWASFQEVLDSIDEEGRDSFMTQSKSETDLLREDPCNDSNHSFRKRKERWVNFFHEDDFQNSTWLEVVLPSMPEESVSAMGLAAVMAATVIIHPLIFVAGVGTAMWAVGVFHAAEKSYEVFSDFSFSQMFWADTTPDLKQSIAMGSEADVIESQKRRVKDAKKYAEEMDRIELEQLEKDNDNAVDKQKDGNDDIREVKSSKSIITAVSPTPSMLHSFSSPRHQRHKNILNAVKEHFPPLQNQVVQNVEFPGLNAVEFFEVFFSNDAPYSLKEFQETRGDVDIEFGKWRKIQDDEPISFHLNVEDRERLTPFPPSSKKERVLRFKTLTKSSFGPTYASAKKTMRVTKLSRRFIIIESKTELFDIPYCDRFFVLDRWVIEAERHSPKTPEADGEDAPVIYTSKLSVDVEVFMKRSCAFERQIQSKSLSTIEEFVVDWTGKATQALQLTVKKKLDRMRSYKDDKSVISWKSPSVSTNGVGNSEQAIMRLHEEKLRELEKKIAEGDLEWCSVETRLLNKHARVRSEVLNPNGRLLPDDNKTDQTPRPLEIAFTTRDAKQKGKKPQKRKIMRVLRQRKV